MPSTVKQRQGQRRAIGVVRVSQVGGRDLRGTDGDAFHSPQTQAQRIRATCGANGWALLDTNDAPELNVSGRASLDQRPALRAAVEAIEAGTADVLVTAYVDRFTREPAVRDEVIDRVEAAGGIVWTADTGQQTNATAGQQMHGSLDAVIGRYVLRVAAEKSRDAVAETIRAGVLPFPNVTPGYVLGADRRLTVDPVAAKVVLEAFQRRADGATVAEVRRFLLSQGIIRSYHGVQSLLGSRIVLGEIHFGKHEPNLSAHPAVVPVDLWRRVQRVKVPRGRRGQSDQLLARLGVLRCASCGGPMIAALQTQNGRRYPFYRCGHVREDCPARAAISAAKVEPFVVERVRSALADVTGRASAVDHARDVQRRLAETQTALDEAVRGFADAGLVSEPVAVEQLARLREQRDAAQDAADEVIATTSSVTLSASEDWDTLSLDAQRALIRATVERVEVVPGRGLDRVAIRLVGETER